MAAMVKFAERCHSVVLLPPGWSKLPETDRCRPKMARNGRPPRALRAGAGPWCGNRI